MAKTLKDAKQELIYVRDKLYDSLSTAEDNGKQKGKKEGRNEVWGAIQNYGKRDVYSSAFTEGGWNKENFKPIYDMRPTALASAFIRTNNSPADAPQIDFIEVAEEQGIVFDFSNCTNFHMAFATGGISRLGVVDLKGGTNLTYTFYGAYNSTQGLRSIEKLICYETNVFQNTTFQGCQFLTDLNVEGVIASSIDFSSCPLGLDSAISVIEHLVNLSSNKGSATIAISKHTADLLDENNTQITTPEGYMYDWRTYITDFIYWGLSI